MFLKRPYTSCRRYLLENLLENLYQFCMEVDEYPDGLFSKEEDVLRQYAYYLSFTLIILQLFARLNHYLLPCALLLR